MISSGRMLAIFRKKGGSGQSTKTADELSDAQRSQLADQLGKDTPLIVSIPSPDNWFVLTKSQIIAKRGEVIRKIPLAAVEELIAPSGQNEWLQGKQSGGAIVILLQDGTRFSMETESPGPFFGLANLVRYIVRMNRKGVEVQ